MIKQTLFFTTPVSLSLKYNQIEIRCKDTEEVITRPIEDVGVVIVENQMVHFTVPLLNALADNNVAVIFCNAQCMPNTMLMPLESNAVQQEVYILKPYYMNVLSGDSDNREGLAAKIYWRQMYGRQFNRNRNGEQPNSLLNYGYAILRAAVTRALLGSGLFPAFGLFHRNRYNAFPLADDIMEPYRPFVDQVVYQIFVSSPDTYLDKEAKQLLVKVLFTDVKINGQIRPLQVALSITTASLVRALKDKKENIIYPSFV